MVALASKASVVSLAAAPEHIIDTLIAERAPKLRASVAWPIAKPLLYGLLHYRRARALADTLRPMAGRDALETVSAQLSLRVQTRRLERVPREGPVVVVFNHPTGLADGVAAYDALKTIRPDVLFFANADAHRVVPGFHDVLIPVEWVEAKRTRQSARRTLERAKAALEAGRCLGVAPAGRISRRQPDGSLRDPVWHATAVSLARRQGAVVIPIHIAGPWSFLFHGFHRISQELRDITLFHELLNKRGGRFVLTVGPPIPPQALAGDAADVTARLKAYVEQVLLEHPDQPFA
jgi:putative hemolysin